LGRFVKEEFGIRDLEKLTTNHIRDFLDYKKEMGVSYSHWSGYAAAIGKLENALNRYSQAFNRGNNYDFRAAVRELRPEAQAELPRFQGTRHYDNPYRLINAISNQTHQLVARIQHESGLRVAGASIVTIGQLQGLATDRLTGKAVGVISYVGKGGKAGTAQMSPETYQRLATHVGKCEELNISADGYRASLKEAAQATGQTYNGSHGLRWNFARERFQELQGKGLSYENALGMVSHEMGHNRIEITEHYLGLR
jgi:integrase